MRQTKKSCNRRVEVAGVGKHHISGVCKQIRIPSKVRGLRKLLVRVAQSLDRRSIVSAG